MLRVRAVLWLAVFCCLGLAACGGTDPVEQAACLCTDGAAGTTAWCELHKTGWVDGKKTADKAAVDAALAAEVAANAKAKGQSGTWIENIVSDVATGRVKKKKCSCESCAKGETDHEVE